MSRARPFLDKKTNKTYWMDQKSRATVQQLELLSAYEDIPLDDLLDEGLTQKQLLYRLRVASDSSVIPPEVLERRREHLRQGRIEPKCRVCSLHGWECEGRITRHHFIPRWLMKELENYVSYASRSACTISICLGRHRDLHYRGDGTVKSIVPYMREHERKFAHKMLDELKEQHPKIYLLLEQGEEDYAYESQLVLDHMRNRFLSTQDLYALPEYDSMAGGATLG